MDNPQIDNSILYLLLSLAGVLITLLLGGNLFWIKRLVKSFDLVKAHQDDQEKALVLVKNDHENFKKSTRERLVVVENRLNDHSKTLKEHTADIANLKPRKK